MILRPVRPVSPCGPPTTKRPVGLMRNSVLFGQQLGRQHLPDHFLDQKSRIVGVLHALGVLRGDDDVGNADRLVVLVDDAETWLFASGRSQVDLAALADARQLAAQTMGEHDRRRHQLGRLVARVPKHQALVARALLGVALALGGFFVHALRDVGALRGDDVGHEDLVRVKNVVVVHVADLAHGVAHDLDVIQLRLGGDLAADDDDVALRVGLAGHAAGRVLRQAGVEHGVGNGVANLVGMSFTDGFGGKDVTAGHAKKMGAVSRCLGDLRMLTASCLRPVFLRCKIYL